MLVPVAMKVVFWQSRYSCRGWFGGVGSIGNDDNKASAPADSCPLVLVLVLTVEMKVVFRQRMV